jgi:phenylpropionate dioxygenase-like ring-hydroxylating dioxygenase large terminal subunit
MDRCRRRIDRRVPDRDCDAASSPERNPMSAMFLHNYWYAAALSAEIADKPFGRTICGEPIVFFRGADGAIAALEDRCAHRHAPLSLGTVQNGQIECAYHGLRYDASGACTHVPGQASVPPRARVRRYAAEDRWGWVWVWIGDAAAADPAAIPHFPWFASDQWNGFHKYFHVEGAAQLFVDNLLDLSHVAFTHQNSIGSRAAADVVPVLDLKVEGDRATGRRRMIDVEPGPFIAKWGNFAGRIERCSTYRWQPPSVIEITAEFSDARNKITIMVINPITPETGRTSHFWLGWARDFMLGDAALTEGAVRDNTQVILEDVRVIEAQQRRIEQFPGVAAVPINADQALVAVHKILDRLFAEQKARRQKAAS